MPLRYLLDTNICIYIMKQRPQSVLEKFEQLEVGMVGMSAITYGELLYGAQKSSHSKKSEALIHQIGHEIPALPLSLKASEWYGKLRAELEKKGKIIGNNDLWIAAHCLALDVILVTNNEKEFSRIDQLTIENWVNPGA